MAALQPVMLQHLQPRHNREKKGGGPGKQDHAIGRFNGAEQTPLLVQHQIAVTQRRERHRRKVKRGFEIRGGAVRKINQSAEPDFDRVDGEVREHHEQDQRTLSDQAFLRPESLPLGPQQAQQRQKPHVVKQNRCSDQHGGQGQIFNHRPELACLPAARQGERTTRTAWTSFAMQGRTRRDGA
jgi:hypothetical protein